MDTQLLLKNNKEQTFQPEDFFFVFKLKTIETPIVVNLTEVQRILKKVKIQPIYSSYPYFIGTSFFEKNTIPIIDLEHYLYALNNINTKKTQRQENYSNVVIFKNKNKEIFGIIGLSLLKEINKLDILSELDISALLTEKIFPKVFLTKNNEIMFRIDLIALFNEFKSNVKDFYQRLILSHSKKNSLTIKIYDDITYEEKFSKNIPQIPFIFSSLKTRSYELKKKEDTKYELIVRINNFFLAFDLEDIFAVARKKTLFPVPQSENPFIIGMTQVKNQNILIISPKFLVNSANNDYIIKKREKKIIKLFIVISHPKIPGYWGIPVDEVLPSIEIKEEEKNFKNIFSLSSEIDNKIIFDAITWYKNKPFFHLNTKRLLTYVINAEVFEAGTIRKSIYTSCLKTEKRKKIENISTPEEEQYLKISFNNINYYLHFGNIEYVSRKIEVFPLNKKLPSIVGWTVYKKEILPVIDLFNILYINFKNEEKEKEITSFIILDLQKTNHNYKNVVLLVQDKITLGKLDLRYFLKQLNLEKLFNNNYIDKIGFTKNNRLGIVIDIKRLVNELFKLSLYFENNYSLEKEKVELAITKDEYFKKIEIEKYKLKEENRGVFVFGVDKTLFGIEDKFVISFIGKFKKLRKKITELRDQIKGEKENISSKVVILEEFLNLKFNLNEIYFAEFSEGETKLFIGFGWPLGIYYYLDDEYLDFSKISSSKKKNKEKEFFKLFPSINFDIEKNSFLTIIKGSITFPNFLPEVGGKTVFMLNYQKLFSYGIPLKDFWREQSTSFSEKESKSKRRNS